MDASRNLEGGILFVLLLIIRMTLLFLNAKKRLDYVEDCSTQTHHVKETDLNQHIAS